MLPNFGRVAVLAVLAVVGIGAVTEPATAADFRVENRVFVEDQRTPISRSLTLFCQGQVFDILDDAGEAILFDPAAGRLTLLDPARKLRADLTTAEVAAFVERVNQAAAGSRDPLIKFAASPSFSEKRDADDGEITLAGPWMTYRALPQPGADAEAARQYAEFSDWLARLNTALQPGSRPPGARLALNAALAGRPAIPRRVELTLNSPKPGVRPSASHSTHELAMTLTPDDLARVAELRRQAEEFRATPLAAYRKGRQR
jgi:hypothetical protein